MRLQDQVAAYVRVSSRSQDLAMQRLAIERAARARGNEIGCWYSEKKSARTVARPELDRLRADARAGRIRRLYIFRLDRLTRSGIRDTLEVVDELRRHGVELVTVSDGFDLEGPAAEIVLAVMAWSARMERVAINERISAARDRLEAQGRSWGRPKRMTAAQTTRAVQLREQGHSVRAIAKTLRVPRSTVARTISTSQKLPAEIHL